jgi:D-glycero-D-manno-heptose 1,7-bisphosphate phosphatase
MSPRKPAVFIDRDGVLIEDVDYLDDPGDIAILPGAAEGIAALNRAGWPVVIVTNQSGVARGLFSAATVELIHDRLLELLEGYGARIAAIYYCPHHPTSGLSGHGLECDCRKPRPGMLHKAAAELGLDLASSWMIGDRLTDLQAGAAAGCRTVLVRTGKGEGVNAAGLDRDALNLDLIAASLGDAVVKLGLVRRSSAA